MARKEKGHSLSALQKRLLIIAGCVVGVLVLIYLGISVFFMNRFLFRTTLNGMDVSSMTAAAVEEKEASGVAAYELKITCRDGSVYTLYGTDFSLEEQWDDGIVKLAKSQSGFAWIGSLFSDTSLELEGLIVYDAEELENALNELDFMQAENQVAAIDASVSEYSAADGYTLVPSEEGTQIDEEMLLGVLDAAIMALSEEVDLAESGCYLEAEIQDDDATLLATIDELNSYVKAQIIYTVGDDTWQLDGGTICEWLSVTDDGQVVLDEDAIAEYVSALADQYNTCYSSKTLDTSYGKTVTITNIHYGWKVDTDTETEQLISEIKAGESVTRDLNYSMTANSHSGNDYGNSYVEINLTAQHLYLYNEGALVLETDFVSGKATSADTITPTGAFTVTYTQRDAILNGDGYSTPVSFWMPFYGNYGMHDATWRSSFGGTIYKTNGSHGCVNLPYSAAQTIYNTISKGWPVLIYNLEGTESGTEEEKEAAEEVTDAIDGISDTVTLEDEDAITSARELYDALSSTAKDYVTNYDKLTEAEDALEQLQQASEESEEEAS